MEIEIISEELIKPSSPTPHHLKTYKVSFLDQYLPSTYVPTVFFYPIDDQNPIQKDDLSNEKRSQRLKQSLSQTLSRFYPLAGKIKDDLSIDCNDEGVYYVEARVKSLHMSEFLSKPDISQIKKFLPCDPSLKNLGEGAHVAMVQSNMFDCGGIAIGVYVTHMIADGVAFSTFLKNWAATARGCCDDGAVIKTPDFATAPSLFPQNDSFPKQSSMWAMLYKFSKRGKPVTRRFVFDSSAIATLKEKATSSSVQYPSRVEVVSALFWKRIMAALGTKMPSLLSHTVNLRRRAGPPFSEFTMGNLLGLAVAQCTAETEAETELCQLVQELRRAITKATNGTFLKTLEGDQGYENFCEALNEMGGVFSNASSSSKGVEFVGFTSWVNFGLYEVDFGWGKPMWATSAGSRDDLTTIMLNYVFLRGTRWGDGIEAWVTLDAQDMTKLECDEELLAFASLDPSPLQIGNVASRSK